VHFANDTRTFQYHFEAMLSKVRHKAQYLLINYLYDINKIYY